MFIGLSSVIFEIIFEIRNWRVVGLDNIDDRLHVLDIDWPDFFEILATEEWFTIDNSKKSGKLIEIEIS